MEKAESYANKEESQGETWFIPQVLQNASEFVVPITCEVSDDMAKTKPKPKQNKTNKQKNPTAKTPSPI